MDNTIADKWDANYSNHVYIYGTEPNVFFKQQIEKISPGRILFPAEGEGRNAIYAAKLGWNVSAFDISKEGRKKALLLAKENHVSIDYKIGTLDELHYRNETFDVIGLFYAHFDPLQRRGIHKKLLKLLKTGGILILEGFNKKHVSHQAVNKTAGGPKNEATLFSIEELREDFDNLQHLLLEELETILSEGIYHKGDASVVRFVGKKP